MDNSFEFGQVYYFVVWCRVRRLVKIPMYKSQDWAKLEVFTDGKSNVAKIMTPFFFLDSVENIVGKGENVDNQHFLLY